MRTHEEEEQKFSICYDVASGSYILLMQLLELLLLSKLMPPWADATFCSIMYTLTPPCMGSFWNQWCMWGKNLPWPSVSKKGLRPFVCIWSCWWYIIKDRQELRQKVVQRILDSHILQFVVARDGRARIYTSLPFGLYHSSFRCFGIRLLRCIDLFLDLRTKGFTTWSKTFTKIYGRTREGKSISPQATCIVSDYKFHFPIRRQRTHRDFDIPVT